MAWRYLSNLKILQSVWLNIIGIKCFNLKQSPAKVPVVCQETQKLIDEYKVISNSNIPKWFDEGIRLLDNNRYLKALKKVAKTLHENVAWRFKKVEGQTLNIYQID